MLERSNVSGSCRIFRGGRYDGTAYSFDQESVDGKSV